MLASEIIKTLQYLIAKYGKDLPVYITDETESAGIKYMAEYQDEYLEEVTPECFFIKG